MRVDIQIYSAKNPDSNIECIPKLCKILKQYRIEVGFLIDYKESFLKRKVSFFGVDIYPGVEDEKILGLFVTKIKGSSIEEKIEYIKEEGGIPILLEPLKGKENEYLEIGNSRTGIKYKAKNPIVGSGAKLYDELGRGFVEVDDLEDLYKKKIKLLYLDTKYSKVFEKVSNLLKFNKKILDKIWSFDITKFL